jgi:hypothetical protein
LGFFAMVFELRVFCIILDLDESSFRAIIDKETESETLRN